MNVRVIPHKRDKTKWAVDYYCPATKKRKYESFGNKAEAVARKKELEGKAATGEYRPLHRRTWAEFVEDYRSKELVAKRPKTRKAFQESVAHFGRLCLPGMMHTVTTRSIDEFKAKRSSEELGSEGTKRSISPHTVNKALRCLRTMLRVAHRWGYLPILPEFKLLKTPDHEPRAIPPQVFERILNAASETSDRLVKQAGRRNPNGGHPFTPGRKPCSDWWVAFISVAYLGGLRWEEILSMRWADLRFTSKPEIHIWNQKAGRHDCLPMSKMLYERLKVWMGKCPNVADEALVFPHACHSRTIRAEWERIQTAAGIADPYRFHDLRVSFCTNLVAAGIQAPVLMKLSRHRSLATTMKYYRGKTEETDRKALELMEATFSKVENGQQADAEQSRTGERSGEQVLTS